MTSCTNHVAYQLPNTHSRVGYLLDGIEYDNAGLLLAIANVENDTGPGGRRDDVEACASHILPKDPVAKTKSSTTKRTSAVTGSKTVTSANTSKKKGKSGIRHSGVHLCYHKPEQYNSLTDPKKKELHEWNASNNSSKKRGDTEELGSFSKKQSQFLDQQ